MCVFCRILAGDIPASVVYEDDYSLAFLDIQPITPGHVLLIPKVHAASLIELDQASAARLMIVAQKVDQALRQSGLACEGVNLYLADGAAAGQEVFHVHLHVFPRFAGDGFGLRLSESYHQPPGRAKLDQNAILIREAFYD